MRGEDMTPDMPTDYTDTRRWLYRQIGIALTGKTIAKRGHTIHRASARDDLHRVLGRSADP